MLPPLQHEIRSILEVKTNDDQSLKFGKLLFNDKIRLFCQSNAKREHLNKGLRWELRDNTTDEHKVKVERQDCQLFREL